MIIAADATESCSLVMNISKIHQPHKKECLIGSNSSL